MPFNGWIVKQTGTSISCNTTTQREILKNQLLITYNSDERQGNFADEQ